MDGWMDVCVIEFERLNAKLVNLSRQTMICNTYSSLNHHLLCVFFSNPWNYINREM